MVSTVNKDKNLIAAYYKKALPKFEVRTLTQVPQEVLNEGIPGCGGCEKLTKEVVTLREDNRHLRLSNHFLSAAAYRPYVPARRIVREQANAPTPLVESSPNAVLQGGRRISLTDEV